MNKRIAWLVLWLAVIAAPASSNVILPIALVPINVALTPSRVSGVAPLTVFFDATATTAGATGRPFSDLEYRWDFGDSGGGNWGDKATGSAGSGYNLSRNTTTGPVAVHVFETPGTKTVTLNVFDGTVTTPRTVSITVDDPDVVFSGTNTICIGTASDPTPGSGGCPTGAAHHQQSNFATIVSSYLAAGKRVLLKAADIFTGSTTATVSVDGPWTLGAYPIGSAAKIQNSGSSIPVISLGAGAGTFPNDGRIVDLEINGSGTASPTTLGSIKALGNFDQLTMLRLYIHDLADGPQFYAGQVDLASNTHIWDEIALVDSTVQAISGGSATHGIYAFATRLSVLGSLIDDTRSAEHLIRIEYADRGVFNHNTFSRGPDATGPAGCKETFALRGVGQNAGDAYYFSHVLPTPSPTQSIVVTDNKFDISCFTGFLPGPVNDVTHTTIQNIIEERNWFMSSGTPVADTVIITSANGHVIRNEIIDMTPFRDYQPVTLNSAFAATTPAASNVEIYHHTFYSSANPAQHTMDFVELGTGNSNVTVKNNLVYAPALSGGFDRILRGTGTNVVISNNSTDANLAPATDQIKLSSPNFTSVSPFNPANAKPVCTVAYPCAQGTAVPVWSDFFRVAEPGTRTIGAVNP